MVYTLFRGHIPPNGHRVYPSKWAIGHGKATNIACANESAIIGIGNPDYCVALMLYYRPVVIFDTDIRDIIHKSHILISYLRIFDEHVAIIQSLLHYYSFK